MSLYASLIHKDQIKALAHLLSEPEAHLEHTLRAAVPAVLYGIIHIRKEARPALIQSIQHWRTLSESLQHIPIAGSAAYQQASDLSRLIFEEKESGVLNLLSHHAALSVTSARALLSVAVDQVLAKLSERCRVIAIREKDVLEELAQTQEEWMAELPSGMSGFIARGAIVDPVSYPDLPIHAAKRWCPPILITMMILAGLWYWWRTQSEVPALIQTAQAENRVSPKKVPSRNIPAGMVDAEGNWISKPGDIDTLVLPNGVRIMAFRGFSEERLLDELRQNNTLKEPGTWIRLDEVYFGAGSADILPQSEQNIQNLAVLMKSSPERIWQLGGFVDLGADSVAAVSLSKARALSVLKALKEQGTDPSYFFDPPYLALGNQFPIEIGDDPEIQALNSRVALRLMPGKRILKAGLGELMNDSSGRTTP